MIAVSQPGSTSDPKPDLAPVCDQQAAARGRMGSRRRGSPGSIHQRPGWIRIPCARTISAGARVIARRSQQRDPALDDPCMTTCPAIVPTDEEANPEASRAMPKIVAALSENASCEPS